MDLDSVDINKLTEGELDALIEKLEAVAKKSPLDYVPHSKQKAFHCAQEKIRAMFGGNRSGKTEAGVLEAWFHASGDYPEWYPKEHRFLKATRGRIIVTDYKNGGAVLDEKISKWFPQSRITYFKRVMGHIEKFSVRHKSGGQSSIEVLTHEQDDMSFEGWSGHWAWFDEPPPREKFIATQRGLVDFGGRCWLTLTPISEPWLFDEVVNKKDGRRWFTTVDIRDNPYLSEKDILDFEATLDEDSKEARLHGKFRHLAGLVYKEFNPDVHLVSFDQFTKAKDWKSWPTWFVLDPADRRPHHGIWAKVDPMENIWVFDELVFKGTIKETAEQIKIRERMWKVPQDGIIRYLDPNKGRTPSSVSGMKLVDEFAQHDVYFDVNVNDDVALGHLAVKELLSYDRTKPLSTTNSPKIHWVTEYTKECVRQIQSYVWDDWKGVSKGARSEKEQVKDVNKDMPDCVRYLAVKKPCYYNPFESDLDPRPFGGGTTGYGY